MNFIFKWRRRFFWRKSLVMGHSYDANQDKMCLYFPDGSLREIKNWKNCEVALGTDWVLATKKRMEQQAGQAIPLAVETK